MQQRDSTTEVLKEKAQITCAIKEVLKEYVQVMQAIPKDTHIKKTSTLLNVITYMEQDIDAYTDVLLKTLAYSILHIQVEIPTWIKVQDYKYIQKRVCKIVKQGQIRSICNTDVDRVHMYMLFDSVIKDIKKTYKHGKKVSTSELLLLLNK
jgi:hypothetical protein